MKDVAEYKHVDSELAARIVQCARSPGWQERTPRGENDEAK